jgi:hypothetical protein
MLAYEKFRALRRTMKILAATFSKLAPSDVAWTNKSNVCRLQTEQCCAAVASDEVIDIIGTPLEAEINAQCASPRCTMKQLNYLSAAQKRAYDRSNGTKN